ncbi:DUF222 domain-containing protein [Arthrobacter psychrolactophilus]
MDETTRVSGESIPDAQGGRVGEHVHQLLNLARALIHATTTSPAGTTTTSPAEDEAVSDGGETSRAASPAFLSGAPFGVDLSGLTDQECVGWAQDLERLAHFQQALAVQVASEVTHRTVAGRYSALGVRGPVDMLTQSLKVSVSEASRRIALGDVVFPSPDVITGALVPALQPVVGDAFFTGRFGAEQAVIVSKFVAEAGQLLSDGRISVEKRDEVEASLVESAATEDPDFLRRIGNRIMIILDPDGQKPGPAELRAKQGIMFRKARRGLVGFSGHLTIEQYEIMLTTVGRFANPNHHKNINPTTTDTNGGVSDGMTGESGFFTTVTDPLTGESAVVSGETLGRLWADGISDLTNYPTNNKTNGTTNGGSDNSGDSNDRDGAGAGNGNSGSDGAGKDNSNTGVGGGKFSFINPPVPEPATVVQPTLWLPNMKVSSEPPAPATGQQPRLWLPDTASLREPPAPTSPPDLPSGSAPPFTTASEVDAAAQHPVDGSGVGVGPADSKTSGSVVPDSSPGSDTAAPESSEGSDVNGSAWVGWESIWDDSGPLIPLPPEETSTGGGTSDSGTASTAGASAPFAGGVGYLGSGGVWIPAPGSGEMLEGLDPIDPESTDRVVADDRSYPQKLLDGIIDCLQLAARTGELPLNGGLKAQLIITTSQEDLERRDGRGTAFTVHSGPVPLSLFDQSLCDPEITRLTYGVGQEILSVGRAERLFTPPQRKILLARDLGCCFPDCTALAVWCEAHHIIPWQEGGETNINNAALLCSKHHSQIHHSDWSMELIHGTPFFTAPYLLDPSETLRRNTFHHGLPRPNYPELRSQGWN